MQGEVKVLRLITGEEIIGEVEKIEHEVIYLKYVLGIAMDQQNQRLVFVPFMPYTNAPQELVVPFSSLMFEPLAPVDSIANDYNEVIAKIHNRIIAPTRSIIRPVK